MLTGLAVLVSPAVADVYIAPGSSLGGTLTWSFDESEVTASGAWKNESTKFEYLVTRPEAGPYTYVYKFTAPDPTLSHLDIQVSGDMSEDGGLPAFSVFNLMDFINTQGYTLDGDKPEVFMVGAGNPPVWFTAGMEAIRFEGIFDTDDADLYTWTVQFDSYRNPMEGNIFAKGGKETAYNTAEGTVLVPNASYVPVPGAVLLGFLGLGYAGMRLRREV